MEKRRRMALRLPVTEMPRSDAMRPHLTLASINTQSLLPSSPWFLSGFHTQLRPTVEGGLSFQQSAAPCPAGRLYNRRIHGFLMESPAAQPHLRVSRNRGAVQDPLSGAKGAAGPRVIP